MTKRRATTAAGAAGFFAGAAAMVGVIGWALRRSAVDQTNCK